MRTERGVAPLSESRGAAVLAGSWQVRVFFDGECPLCRREVAMLRRLDRGRGRIDFDDIAAPGFDPAVHGSTAPEMMARIHGLLPDGTRIEGMEVFRRAYSAVGLGFLLAPTRWPLLRPLADALYRLFARNRLRWTGRSESCATGSCTTPAAGSGS